MEGHEAPWAPREHDHVVEPIFAGLRGHEHGRAREAGAELGESRAQRRLWIAAAAAVTAIAARAWMLL